MSTDVYKHQTAYNEKMQALGLIRITVWVPKDDKHAIIDHAEQLRKTNAVKAKPVKKPAKKVVRKRRATA